MRSQKTTGVFLETTLGALQFTDIMGEHNEISAVNTLQHQKVGQ